MRLRVAFGIVCLLPALAGCIAREAPPPTPTSYTCCADLDVDRDYQPGETLPVRWTLIPGAPGAQPVPYELDARLTGPYANVDELKAATIGEQPVAGVTTVAAEPIHPEPGEQPVSQLQIPPGAGPGFYNLVTEVAAPGDTFSGATIIHVVAGA